jgi:hemerythrin-like domain-containing protein
MPAARKKDVVDVLADQHEQIKTLFDKVKTAKGVQKQRSFDELVRLLTVHEAAEEEILHPVARMHVARGEEVVRGRLEEEHDAKLELARLCELGVDHPDFDRKLTELATMVIRHADNEEQEEFASLRENLSKQRLYRMAGAVRAAERTAPTRPHPAAGESAAAQLLVGTPVGVIDRMRDTIRHWREPSMH